MLHNANLTLRISQVNPFPLNFYRFFGNICFGSIDKQE